MIVSSFLLLPPLIVKAKDSKTKANLYKIYLALEDYYDSNGSFPKTLPDCDSPLTLNSNIFLNNIPCDPFDDSNYLYESNLNQSNGDWFKLYAKLRNLDDPIIVLTGCLNGCGPECEYNYGIASSNMNIDKCHIPIYACSPGSSGGEGRCEEFDNPEISECPKIYTNDPTCKDECSEIENRCKNAAGKHQPDN